MSSLELITKLILGTVVIMTGWWVVHWLNSVRDQANKRRELIVGYLINAYRNIEKAAFAFDPNAHKDNVESAIADIQLFGSLKQVRLAQEFSDRMSNETTADVRELLTDLRNELRKELVASHPETQG